MPAADLLRRPGAALLASYRRTGADLPFGDPRRTHGVAMEGWFWRLTHVPSGTVVIALLGVNRGADGRPWGTVGLAAHPAGFSRSAAVPHAFADRDGRRMGAGDALRAQDDRLLVDLGPDARLDVRFTAQVGWPRRVFGGIGAAQAIPGLSQYWHPFAMGGTVSGAAVLGGVSVNLDGATLYAEKNWGAHGFPPAWWWGQAQAFGDADDVCVAFAGGRAGVGPLKATATSLVARVGRHVQRVVRPLRPLRVVVDDQRWVLSGGGIEVEGHANGTNPHVLPVPLPAQGRNLDGAAHQHLAGEMRVLVRRRGRTVYEGVSALAGLERGGLALGAEAAPEEGAARVATSCAVPPPLRPAAPRAPAVPIR